MVYLNPKNSYSIHEHSHASMYLNTHNTVIMATSIESSKKCIKNSFMVKNKFVYYSFVSS